MDCRLTLIEIYLFICKRSGHIDALAQRQSNNRHPSFTDAEVLTIYLFGLMKKRRSVREIYDYAADHFAEWFPNLPSYQSYNRRLNRMSAVFAPLAQAALSQIDCGRTQAEAVRIVDSMPIMLAKEKRSSRAKVAPQLADKGYCSSKGTFYYGVKLHAVAQRRSGALPVPSRVGLTSGSENDLTALRRVLPTIEGGELYGDKAYCDSPMKKRLVEEQDLDVHTPVKRKKGQERLSAASKLFSTAVSKVRQPIESLFNWINEKTDIQRASKVRSYRGLLVHAFGRFAAAMLLLSFNS